MPSPVEGQNIVTGTISIFGGNPSDFPCQICVAGFSELAPLDINNKSFPSIAKRAIAIVPCNRIKFTDERALQTLRNRLCRYCWRSDKDFARQRRWWWQDWRSFKRGWVKVVTNIGLWHRRSRSGSSVSACSRESRASPVHP